MKKDIVILTLEDISSVANGIKEHLINDLDIKPGNIHCYVFADDAIDFLEKNTPDIIIVDLAMDPVGLTATEQAETNRSRLTGWVFLKNYVFNGEFKDRLKNTHCYIFSGYGKIFLSAINMKYGENGINIDEINKKLRKIRENVYFVSKVGSEGGAKQLISMIKKYSFFSIT